MVFVHVTAFLCSLLLVCIVAFGVGSHSAVRRAVRRISICVGRFRPPVEKSKFSMTFIPEGVLISDFTVYVDTQQPSSDQNTFRQSFFQSYSANIFDIRVNNRYGKRCCRGFGERTCQWVRLRADARPMSNVVSGSSAKILNFDCSGGKSFVGNVQSDSRNSNVCPQLFQSGVFHLSDNAFRLQPSLNHLCFLLLSNIRLSVNNFKLSNQEPYLESADNNQESTKQPIKTVSPILRYRHGGKFADSYGLLCIIVSLFVSMCLGGLGLILIDGGRRKIGWFIFGFSLVLNITACTSGAIGCLPWSWRRCLWDRQEHSQNQAFDIQAALLQNTGSIPSSCVS